MADLEEGNNIPILSELVTQETTLDDFEKLAIGTLTPADRKILGEAANRKIVNALASLGAMGDLGFNRATFNDVCATFGKGEVLSSVEVDLLLDIAKRTGLIKHNDKYPHDPNKMIISNPDLAANLERILDEA